MLLTQACCPPPHSHLHRMQGLSLAPEASLLKKSELHESRAHPARLVARPPRKRGATLTTTRPSQRPPRSLTGLPPSTLLR